MELSRRHGDFGIVAVASILFMENQEACRKASIALGGVAPTPLRAAAAEKILAGRKLTEELIREAGIKAAGATEPESDYHASAEYRKDQAQGLHPEKSARGLEQGQRGEIMSPRRRRIKVKVNGREYEGLVEPRRHLVDFLREDLGLVGTHVGCEHGICGSCTVLMNGEPVRSLCLVFAVQADGAEIMTVEGLRPGGKIASLAGGLSRAPRAAMRFLYPRSTPDRLPFSQGESPTHGGRGAPGHVRGVVPLHPLQAGCLDSVMAAAAKMRGA